MVIDMVLLGKMLGVSTLEAPESACSVTSNGGRACGGVKRFRNDFSALFQIHRTIQMIQGLE